MDGQIIKKISVIVPTYNVRQHIENCCKCLDSQKFHSYEIIFVDDCSSDGTYEWLLDYKKNKDNVFVYRNEENIGAAVARNLGLARASGEYVLFLDADDSFYENMLFESYFEAKKNNADVVVFSYERVDVYDSKLICSEHIKPYRVVDEEKSTLLLQMAETVPWNKLVRKDFLDNNKILFQNLKSNNDVFFAYAVILKANRIVFTDKILMKYYYGREGSLTSSRHEKRVYIVEAFEAVYQLICENLNQHKLKIDFLNMILDSIRGMFYSEIYTENVKQQLHSKLCNSQRLMEDIKLYTNEIYCHNKKFVEELLKNKEVFKTGNRYEYFMYGLLKVIDIAKKQNRKIALWGCGKLGKEFIDMLNLQGISIDYVVDRDEKKHGLIYGGYKVQSYYDLEKVDIILVLNPLFLEEIEKEAKGKEIINVNKL